MEIDVFVSHHTDSSLHIVEAIVNKLEANGVRCWYAPRNTAGSYAGSIARAINGCSLFLLILNKPSSESIHVLNELDLVTKRLARRENVYLVPFHTADEDIGEDAQYYLSRLHWIDAMNPPMYRRIDELVEKILSMLGKPQSGVSDAGRQNETRHVLTVKIPQARDIFVGRDSLLQEMETFFDSGSRVLFLEGIGGIGKSELAKQYALTNRKKYDTILFVTYSDSLRTLVCDPNMIEISGISVGPEEDAESFFRRKLLVLRSLMNKRTLLIVDNFDVDSDPDMVEFLEGSHNVIFTTRNQHPGYRSIKVNAIPDRNVLFDIFERNYGMPVEEEDRPYLEELFAMVEYHTYTIELLAKQMEAGFSSGKELLEMFKSGQMASSASETVVGRHGVNTAFGHIRSLFTMSNLSDTEKQVLREMSLMSTSGIPAKNFWKWSMASTPEAAKQAVLGLVRKSWICRESTDNVLRLSLHPLVREVVRATKELRPTADNCNLFLEQMGDDMYNAWYVPVRENMAIADCVISLAEYFAPFDLKKEDPEFFLFWTMVANFLWQVGRFDDSIQYGHMAYDACLAKYGEASMVTGYAAKSLGGCYFNSRRTQESIKWYKLGLELMVLSGEAENEDLAVSYEKVGRTCTWEYEQDFDKAEELFQTAHEIRVRLKQAVESGAQIRNMESRMLYTAEKVEERIGGNYFEMGRMFQRKGDYEKALIYVTRQEEILKRVAPENVSGIAYVNYDKGVCYYHIGLNERQNGREEEAVKNFNSALEYLSMALESNMKMRGEVAADTIENVEYIADTYAALGRFGEASNHYMQVLAMIEKLFGKDSEYAEAVKRKMSF